MQPVDPVVTPTVVERVKRVFVPRDCGRIKAEWLQGQGTEAKAQGVIADVQAVAEARGAQVEALNARIEALNTNLTRIQSVLRKHGCAEVVK